MSNRARFTWMISGACSIMSLAGLLSGNYEYALLSAGLAVLDGWLAKTAEGS